MAYPKVLIVDDDSELDELLVEYLHGQEIDATAVMDGRDALARLESETFDLIILDVMLPALNGFEILKQIRQTLTTPVIMLTARGEDIDCILGLELGADDYLSKPINPRQLVARIHAVLRRTSRQTKDLGSPLDVGELSLDPSSRSVTVGDQSLAVTGAEFKLLEILMQDVGQVTSRELLTQRVLGRSLSAYDRSVDTHISNLRRKLSSSGVKSLEIRNVRGAGYVLTHSEDVRS